MSIHGELTERNVNPRTRTCVCVRGRLHVVDGLLTVFGTEPRRQHSNKLAWADIAAFENVSHCDGFRRKLAARGCCLSGMSQHR